MMKRIVERQKKNDGKKNRMTKRRMMERRMVERQKKNDGKKNKEWKEDKNGGQTKSGKMERRME